MERLICRVLHIDGLGNADYKTAIVDKSDGGKEHVLVPAHILERENGHFLLPVIPVAVDQKRQATLVQLPCESDSGANRVWVPRSNISEEAPS